MPALHLRRIAGGLILTVNLLACSKPSLFPKDALEGVDTHFDFSAWQTSPSSSIGRKVQLGGRVLDAQPSEQGTLVIARQLPIVEHPAFGPSESLRKPGAGTFQFAFFYPGRIEASALALGNRLIVLGTTQGAKSITVDGSTRSTPFIDAYCLHIWKTTGKEITDFDFSAGGFYPLEELTYCLK